MTESNIDEKLKEYYGSPKEMKVLPRMLFLDDRTKRIEAARKNYTQQYDVTYVHNAKECLRYLCREEFDIVSLDHDLNGDDFQDPDDTTSGMEVVRYIVKCGGFPPSQIVKPVIWIHSSNGFAANLMINELLKVSIHALHRRFEYNPKECTIKDYWVPYMVATCRVCQSETSQVDVSRECHDCYIRELISSSSMDITEYWKMKKEGKL